MVSSILLSSNEEQVAALLSYDHDGHFLCLSVDVEQYSVRVEQPQFALSHRVRTQRFHVSCLCLRIAAQSLCCFFEEQTCFFPPKPACVFNRRFLDGDGPSHNYLILRSCRFMVYKVRVALVVLIR